MFSVKMTFISTGNMSITRILFKMDGVIASKHIFKTVLHMSSHSEFTVLLILIYYSGFYVRIHVSG